jgi:predicted RNA methylase
MEEGIANIDSKMLKIGKDRLEKLGAKDGGMYGYYTTRIDRESMLNNDDEEIINYIVKNESKDSQILEVAAGCGQVSFALEAMSFGKVEFCEFDKRRSAFGRAIAEGIGSSVTIHECDYRDLDLPQYDLVFVVNAVSSSLGGKDAELLIELINSESDVMLKYGYYGVDNEIFDILDDDGSVAYEVVFSTNQEFRRYTKSSGKRNVANTKIDSKEDLAEKQNEAIEIARDWGYFSGSLKQRSDLWKGLRILDVGMGGGPHSLAYISLGAAAYYGIDPLAGTGHVRDFRSNKDPSIPAYHPFPVSTEEMMELFPQISIYSDILENVSEEITRKKPQIAILSAVTEHLQDLRSVFQSIWEVLDKRGFLHLTHCNYYSWTGHHENPRAPANWDKTNEAQNKVIDWKHLDPKHHRYKDVNLNRVRLDDFRRLLNKYFEIVQWKESIIALERLTDEIRKKHKKYTLSELLSNVVHVTCIRRDSPLEDDISNLQFHHPEDDYRSDEDFSDQDIKDFEFNNSVMFSSMGDLASHSDNNHAGTRLFKTLKIGDRLRLRKGLEFLEIEFGGLDDSFGEHPRAKIVDEIPTKILKENFNLWTIEEVMRDGESIAIEGQMTQSFVK